MITFYLMEWLRLDFFMMFKLTNDNTILDPPYEKGLIDEALEGIAKFNLLKENGIIVCEFKHHEHINLLFLITKCLSNHNDNVLSHGMAPS
jgi:16S rRNA G966 N2-methylase RsmD